MIAATEENAPRLALIRPRLTFFFGKKPSCHRTPDKEAGSEGRHSSELAAMNAYRVRR